MHDLHLSKIYSRDNLDQTRHLVIEKMKIILYDDHMRINLNVLEKIGAAKGSFYISYENIVSTFSEPPHSQLGLKIAGTNLPRILELGTYLAERQKQFWYTRKRKYDFLVLVLKSNFYSKIILELQDSKEIADKLNGLLDRK